MAESPPSLAAQQKHPPPAVLKPPRKRRRIVISCTECHRRKQKVRSSSVVLYCTWWYLGEDWLTVRVSVDSAIVPRPARIALRARRRPSATMRTSLRGSSSCSRRARRARRMAAAP